MKETKRYTLKVRGSKAPRVSARADIDEALADVAEANSPLTALGEKYAEREENSFDANLNFHGDFLDYRDGHLAI